MTLSIAILAAAIRLTFETPGAGTYYVFSGTPERAQVIACGWNPEPCHVVVTVPQGADSGLYWASFWPGYTGD